MTAQVLASCAVGIVDTTAEGSEWRMEVIRMNGKLDYFRGLVNAELVNESSANGPKNPVEWVFSNEWQFTNERCYGVS